LFGRLVLSIGRITGIYKGLIDPFVIAEEVNGDPEIKIERKIPIAAFPSFPKKKWKRQKNIWILKASKEFTHLKIPEIKSI
jgi:hypothetical protein